MEETYKTIFFDTFCCWNIHFESFYLKRLIITIGCFFGIFFVRVCDSVEECT